MKNGEVFEHRQGFFKGGAENPLSDDDIQRKFYANCEYGGMSAAQAAQMQALLAGLIDVARVDLSALPV
jgi:hypothetical protein